MRIVPWKKYTLKSVEGQTNSVYIPRSYEENEDGSVTITCEKLNGMRAVFGVVYVFGINPDDLVEIYEEV